MICKSETVIFDLQRNVFSSSLSKLVSLTDLNLSGNHLQSLPPIAFSVMDNLQVLSLHSNRLRAIPDLRRLQSLKVRALSPIRHWKV